MPVVDKNKQIPQDEWMSRLTYSKDFRTKYELTWFSTQMFVEQNAFYVSTDGELKEKRPKKGYRTIAKARKMIRSIKNALTKEEPRRQPNAFTLDEDYTDEDRYNASKFLQKTYREQNVKELIKDILHNSLMKAIGFWEIYRDGECVAINELDGFDVYLDPQGWLRGPKFQGRWIIKAIPMPADIANKKRPQAKGSEFSADNQTAESPQKVTILNNEQAQQNSSTYGTVMVYEFYLKDTPEVKAGAEEGHYDIENPPEEPKTPYTPHDPATGVGTDYASGVDPETGKKTVEQIHRVVYIADRVISDEWMDTDEYPIICYQPERFAGKIYPTPWMDPIVELNKSINKIYTAMEDWVYTFSKGRYLAKRNENISNISSDNGQVVYYDNVPPAYLQQGTPGETPFRVLGLSEQYADDAGGIHAESTGGTSGANIRSSSQIMQMQAGDIQNMSEPLDNLKTFLSTAGEMVLELASKHMSEISTIDLGGKSLQLQGSQAAATLEKLSGTPGEVKKLMPFKNIIVDIVPGTAYTDMQARQDLITLKEAGIQIPDEIFLDTFKVGDTQEILLKMKLQEARDSNPDIDIATAENKKMMMGQEVMADYTDNHQLHKAIHAKFLQANKTNPQLVQMIIAHIKQHEAFERPAPTEMPPGAPVQ